MSPRRNDGPHEANEAYGGTSMDAPASRAAPPNTRVPNKDVGGRRSPSQGKVCPSAAKAGDQPMVLPCTGLSPGEEEMVPKSRKRPHEGQKRLDWPALMG